MFQYFSWQIPRLMELQLKTKEETRTWNLNKIYIISFICLLTHNICVYKWSLSSVILHRIHYAPQRVCFFYSNPFHLVSFTLLPNEKASYRGSKSAMVFRDSGLRSNLSKMLTMSVNRGRLERSCCQHWSMSWQTADGQSIGAGSLKASLIAFMT